jgi:hypothetical protein
VNFARLILICIICGVPTTLLIEGPVVQGLIAAILSGGIVAVVRSMREGEADFLLTLIRPVAGVAIIPVLWMLFQVLPVKAVGLAHPIWQSAEQALGYSVGGSISIDPGATLIALGQYLCMVAIALLTAAVAVERERAEWILFALVIATALVAVVVIVHDAFGLALLDGDTETSGRAQAKACVALGMIFSCAAMIRTCERYETAQFHPDRSPTSLKQTFIACAVAFALCTVAVILNMTGNLLFVIAYGLGTLIAVLAIRRIGLGFWTGLAIATSAGLVAIVVIGSRLATRAATLTLAFATNTSEILISITQRILADAPWTGIGAGALASILPVYREAEIAESGAVVPTAAAKIAIELGWPMLWAIVVAVMAGIFLLLRGALNRGRDSFYAAAGAGSLVFVVLWAFCDIGVLGTPAGICTASIVGLAVAQCKSRSVQ